MRKPTAAETRNAFWWRRFNHFTEFSLGQGRNAVTSERAARRYADYSLGRFDIEHGTPRPLEYTFADLVDMDEGAS